MIISGGNNMSYSMKYALDCVHNPSIESIPTYVKLLLDTCVSSVVIINDDETKEEFDKQINTLRMQYCKGTDYRNIRVSNGSKWTNPYYFHIPGEANSAISVYEAGDHVEIKKIDIDDAIALMRDTDVTTNEILSDKSRLRGIPSYEHRIEAVSQQISEVKKALDTIKQMEPSDIFS